MEITAAAVKSLRDRTGAPMMDCKAALTEAGGDMEKAIEILRKKSKDIQVKKGDREAAEGRIAVYTDSAKNLGSILEMRCESAPVAKSEQFVKLANDIARHVAVQNPTSVEQLLSQPFVDDPKRTVNEVIGEVVGLIRENMKPARFKRLSGQCGSYVHHDGTVGVLVQVEGNGEAQLLRDVCMHITAKNPLAGKREDVSADTMAKEKDIAMSQLAADPKNQNKPANILEKIVEGKMKAWYTDNVLVDQPFVKDDTKTVGDLLKGAGLKLGTFVRYKVGELT